MSWTVSSYMSIYFWDGFLEDKDVKYHGSANTAILQDNIRLDQQPAKARRFEQQQRQQYHSDIITNDSTEATIARHNAQKRKQLEDMY